MRITQGTFSFLPDLTDAQIRRQLEYALRQGWAISVEHTRDPHPRSVYWELWGAPLFDLAEPGPAMQALRACREANPEAYVKLCAFDSTRGWETTRLSFIVQRPAEEAGFELSRREAHGRTVRYELRAARKER
jgi:ribulose-bisphosphate carboxylase small chain